MATRNLTVSDGKGNVLDSRTITVPDEADVLDTIRDALTTALADNRAFVALTPPTNAQLVTQVKQLCVQHNRMIRLLFGILDGTN